MSTEIRPGWMSRGEHMPGTIPAEDRPALDAAAREKGFVTVEERIEHLEARVREQHDVLVVAERLLSEYADFLADAELHAGVFDDLRRPDDGEILKVSAVLRAA